MGVQPHYIEASGKLDDPTVPDDGASAGDGIGHSEFAGPRFSPDGKFLFVNIQVPGITCAITGPWASLGSEPETLTRMTEDVPPIVATPPGPKTREILARQERVLTRGSRTVWGRSSSTASPAGDRGRRRERLPRLHQRDGLVRSAPRVPTSWSR